MTDAVQFPTFQPAMRVITAITNSFPVLVTTSFEHQYQTGLIVRLIIPVGFGMQLANQLKGDITVTSTTQFTMDIDTTNMDPFVIPSLVTDVQDTPDGPVTYYFAPGGQAGPAMSIPVGEINSLLTESTQNVLPYPLHMIE